VYLPEGKKFPSGLLKNSRKGESLWVLFY